MRARRAANARRSAGPTRPCCRQGAGECPGPGDEHPLQGEGPGEEADLRSGEAQRDPDQWTARRLLGHQGLGDQRLLPARRGHQPALVAAGHEEAGAGDEPPSDVASLQSAPEMLRVDDPDARGDHRKMVDVGPPKG